MNEHNFSTIIELRGRVYSKVEVFEVSIFNSS